MLGFLEKLTLEPAAVTAGDVVPLRAQGLSDAAIEEVSVAAADGALSP